MAKFGHGTPDDWLERNVYSKHSLWGVLTMLAIDVALFGAIGLTVWAVQMAWIPFWAAGVVNGIGHYWGYRNYNSPDTSTNVFPWGIVIGGEELHNNHHAHGTSAKFSAKWYEFDIGWCYINILKFLGLAKIKKVAPKLKLDDSRTGIDLRTLQGVITHRYEVMARYADIIKSAAREELAKMKASRQEGNAECGWSKLHKVRRAIHRNEDILQPEQLQAVDQAIAQNKSLSTLVQMRREQAASGKVPAPAANSCSMTCRPGASAPSKAASPGSSNSLNVCAATRHDARKLNPEQRAAVTLEPQHALVLAGAGSGKPGAHHPHGLADSNRPGFAFGLLAVTFTNKAAREMLARMSSILPIDTRGLWIGTFHGLCNRMLRAHHRDAGLPQSFQILDVTDQLAAIKRLMKPMASTTRSTRRATQRFINGARKKGCARTASKPTTATAAA